MNITPSPTNTAAPTSRCLSFSSIISEPLMRY
jgi:hypothetical protein